MRFSTRLPKIVFQMVLATCFLMGVGGRVGKTEAALDTEHFSVGGELRERYEFRNNADFDRSTKDTLSFVGSRIRFHLGYEVTPDVGFFFQMQDSRLFGSEATTVSNEKNLDLHQGYLTLKNWPKPMVVILGRQELVFGDSRLVGNFGWSNVGRSFDGVRAIYNPGPIRWDVWAMVVKQYGTNIGADPTLTTTNQEGQQFYGINVATKKGGFVLEPYVLYLRDTGNASATSTTGAIVSPVTDPAARGQNRATLGFRTDGKLMEDRLDFTSEAAYQTGTMDARAGSTPKSDISAYAVVLKAGYTIPIAVKPRIGIEYNRASGDDTSGDDASNTFENLFPTNHIHYGHIDYVGWRNMQDIRFSFGIKPTKSSSVSMDYHLFSLAEKSDHWYRASGHVFRTTPAGNSKSDIGQEIDVVAYTMVKEKVRLEAGYSHFFPGDYVEANFPAAVNGSDFVYLQMGTSF